MSSYWRVELDPEAAYTGTGITRTPLSLNTGSILIEQEGIDWGEAAVEAFKATSRYGESCSTVSE